MAIRYLRPLILVLILIGTASPQDPAGSDSYLIVNGLTGQVVDASGKGIPGVKIWIIPSEGGVIIGYPASTASPSAIQYGLQYAPQYASSGTGWVQGRIADQSGTGIPYASITVDGFPGSALTDEQGNYRIALSPGMHRLEAWESGYGIPPRVVFISSGQTTNFDLIGIRMIALGAERLRS